MSLDYEGCLTGDRWYQHLLTAEIHREAAPSVQFRFAVAYRCIIITTFVCVGNFVTHLAPLLGTAAGPGSLDFNFKCGRESGFVDELGSPGEGTSRKGIVGYLRRWAGLIGGYMEGLPGDFNFNILTRRQTRPEHSGHVMRSLDDECGTSTDGVS